MTDGNKLTMSKMEYGYMCFGHVEHGRKMLAVTPYLIPLCSTLECHTVTAHDTELELERGFSIPMRQRSKQACQ